METIDVETRRMIRTMTMPCAALAAALALAAAAPLANAHGNAPSEKGHGAAPAHVDAEQHAFGKAGDPARAARTIEVDMHDRLRFDPETIEVETGQTVRFVVRNEGTLMHEMVLGTPDTLDEHAALMQKFPGMEHAEPYMAHVPPGEERTMTWTFTDAGEFAYGCLVPGHFEAGMKGRIVVR